MEMAGILSHVIDSGHEETCTIRSLSDDFHHARRALFMWHSRKACHVNRIHIHIHHLARHSLPRTSSYSLSEADTRFRSPLRTLGATVAPLSKKHHRVVASSFRLREVREVPAGSFDSKAMGCSPFRLVHGSESPTIHQCAVRCGSSSAWTMLWCPETRRE
ncbi:hypothetical protein BDN70DRAFT_722852 [Pholiota conissans]|uniref:Uncharacterized protein n=1 Tax=Pholiota conissans TaxID=109636 RepID=A0A9P5Z0A7_9AGAR|nr:hypothetical protein BDN70DRAFT_722852 [Pholiota conissans]